MEEKKKLGQGSAFPTWDMTFEKNPNTDLYSAGTSRGMSKRLYIAVEIMKNMISIGHTQKAIKELVEKSYVVADELLEQE